MLKWKKKIYWFYGEWENKWANEEWSKQVSNQKIQKQHHMQQLTTDLRVKINNNFDIHEVEGYPTTPNSSLVFINT